MILASDTRDSKRLSQLIQQLTRAVTRDQVLPALAEAARLAPDYSTAVIAADPPGSDLIVCSASGPEASKLAGRNVGGQLSLSGWAIRTAEPVVCPDFATDPRADALRSLGLSTGSGMCVPLPSGGKTWGALVVLSPHAGSFPAAELETVKVLAEVAGSVLQQCDLRRTAEQQVRHLMALHEVSRLLTSSLEPATVLTLIVDVATGLFDLDLCCVLLRDEDRTLRVEAARGLDGTAATALVCPADEPPSPNLLRRADLQVVRFLPLSGRQDSLGYLAAGRRFSPFSEEEHRLLTTWASLAGVALENARLVVEMQAARTDVIATLVGALEARTHGVTDGHARRVAELATAIGTRMGMTEADLRDLEAAALLHDLGGLVRATDGPGADAVHHAQAGANLLVDSPQLCRLGALIQHHHEDWDGSADPSRERSDQIPLGARILRVAECFVELQEGHGGATSVNPLTAFLQIKAGGRRFDPRVMEALDAVVWARLNLTPESAELPNQPVPLRQGPSHPAADPPAGKHPGRTGLEGLTNREQEILSLVARGLSNREIAVQLYLSEATVKTHVSRILQKLGLPDRTKAALYVVKAGQDAER